MTAHDEGLNGAVAAVLRGERAAAGLTIEELAERSGIPAVSVQRFLAARRAIHLEVLDRLCRGLDVRPDEVMSMAGRRMHRGDSDLVARVLAGLDHGDVPPVDQMRENP